MHIIQHPGKQVLVVIPEIFPEDRKPPFVHRLIAYSDAKGELALVIQCNIIQCDIRDAAAINEAPILIDPNELQHAILIQMGGHQSGLNVPRTSPKSPGLVQ